MVILRKSNKKGFGFIVAIGMLGLLAFMGLFLMQSSSAEYSQTSLSVYRTMARQIAEAAADEAAVILEEQFREKTKDSSFDKLLQQAATSKPRSLDDGSTPQNLLQLKDFSKKDLEEVSQLLDVHITRAGFSIDKIHPAITDLRPIPQGPLDKTKCYYCPFDRATKDYKEYKPFDNDMSKDWYCTLQFDITVSLAKQKKTTVNYKVSRDVKIVNVGPIGRNYTYFSILGLFLDLKQSDGIVEAHLRNRLNNKPNEEKGRLFLWNVPFQSRVYMHGPAVVDLENSNLVNYPTVFTNEAYIKKDVGNDGGTIGPGAFLNPPVDSDEYTGPGINMAYQYDDTFYGFSYYPDKSRGVFPGKNLFEKIFKTSDTKGDMPDLTNFYSGSNVTHATILKGGNYPQLSTSFLSKMKDLFIDHDVDCHFFVGSAPHQKFLPAGPLCRTPWRFQPSEPALISQSPFRPNQKDPPPSEFPEDDNKIRLEHRWDPREDPTDEKSLHASTQIRALVSDIKYFPVLNTIDHAEKEQYTDFCVNYYNNPDPEGFLQKLKAGVTHMFKGVVNLISFPIRTLISAADSGLRRIPAFNKLGSFSVQDEDQCINLFPTNFKFRYTGAVTRVFASINDIPRDKDQNWILNGVYWLNEFTLENSISYVGTGTLIITGLENSKSPLTFKGNVLAARGKDGKPLGHLTIFYYPYLDNTKSSLSGGDYLKTCAEKMLTLDGGVTIEASVFSSLGIRSVNGFNATTQDFVNKMNPRETYSEWVAKDALTNLINTDNHANIIKGNYINYYCTLDAQGDDLWVVHDQENPMMFKESEPEKYLLYQEYLDLSENERLEYEIKCHEFFMSPRIQHVGITGAI
jgi:hypothetical protein